MNDLNFDHQHKLPGPEHLSCPGCQKVLDGATGGAQAPQEDNLSMCAYCGQISVFTRCAEAVGQLTLVKITDSQLEELQQAYPSIYSRIMFASKITRARYINRNNLN